jgi:N-acetyl-anhydromuramyl-L-alanine amidase AmpD
MPELKDWLTVVALILGPALAVWYSVRIQRVREKRRAKLWALQAVLANRHNIFADDRLKALNSIDLIYQDDADVRAKWQSYLAQLSHPNYKTDSAMQAEARRRELELISAMASTLGYKALSQMDIDRSYRPEVLNTQAVFGNELLDAAKTFFTAASNALQRPAATSSTTASPTASA